jgi:DNA polymerase, archaea type
MLVQGYLLDCYPSSSGGMTFWVQQDDGRALRFEDKKWQARIYATSGIDDMDYLSSTSLSSNLVSQIRKIRKRTDVFDQRDSEVLELELKLAGKGKSLATFLSKRFHHPDMLQLYNVDFLPEQEYFYEKDLFPLARVEVDLKDGSVKKWILLDSITSYTYSTPALKALKLDIEVRDRVARMDSRLKAIQLTSLGQEGEEEKIRFESSEAQMITDASRELMHLDPDLVLTDGGDSFVLPFLLSRARSYGIDNEFLSRINRDSDTLSRYMQIKQQPGKTYFSYGKIMYRPATFRLFGRLHLDEGNTFVYDQCRLEGLFEVSRLCRIPLHTSMRASIGKCLSSLQFYYASKQNLLIPWKPEIVEDGKNGYDLFVADRGGMVLKPLQSGVYEHVGEIDFSSLYPSIIRKYNISAETVNCSCCPKSRKHWVQELGMHICENEGIIARSLVLPLDKRREYKRLKSLETNPLLKQIYNERSASLKWILVCSFGYLSYRNAKFGKIDSHIAVCALARETLIRAMQTAEANNFQVVHGIVDSLWLYNRNATDADYEELCREIKKDTGFEASPEGIYKWIVFLPSKVYPRTRSITNRYYGCFEKGNVIKVRGIEYRRHDTPNFFRECQGKILSALAPCDSEPELREMARNRGVEIFEEYARDLEEHSVSPLDLIITRNLSKNPADYSSKRQLQVNAALKLETAGRKLQAGQSISYVITRYDNPGRNRSNPLEFAYDEGYDSRRYIELLADCCASVLDPLGVSKEQLLARTGTRLG